MATQNQSNGCPKAKRKDFTELGCEFRATPHFLATIDFGTTHCSLAYLIGPDSAPNPSEVDPTLLKLDDAGNKRVPSCILFDINGKMVAFGQEAREQYAGLDHKLRPHYSYFEHVKKHLQHEKNIDRNQKIFAMNGKQFYLVDVIAHVLHHLKCQLLSSLRDFGYKDLKASGIDWVITVPAIWRSKGKKMMREAGYMAGLCSDSQPPDLCIAISIRNPPQEEESPEKLSLALEPESAAIHCRRKAKEAVRDSEYVVDAKSYIIVDIGGGTVDITSHAIVGSGIEEIATPVGNFWGGTTVNEEFSKFLQDMVDDPKFSCYIGSGTEVNIARHKADLNKLIYTRFEVQKRRFGSGNQESYVIDIPRTFLKLYEEPLVENGRALNLKGDMSVQVEDDGDVIRIRHSKMAEFFKPAIDGITALITAHLRENNIARTIDTIYWVGGFGGCKYLRNQLEMAIKAIFSGFEYHFPVPPEPELAVIRGATAFRCDPGIVTKRKADATYGSICWIPFDPAIHRPIYKQWDQETEIYRCNHIFRAFVERGEDVCTNELFVMDYCPSKRNQKCCTFPLYSAPRKDVWYTTDDDVHKLGEVTVDMGGYGLDRGLELVCDITHTEVQIRARDETSGNVRKVVLDFLSSTK